MKNKTYLPWLTWAMYFTFSKILENRSKDTRPPRIMRGLIKFCPSVSFLELFYKIHFPTIWKLKYTWSHEVPHSRVFIKNIKCLL